MYRHERTPLGLALTLLAVLAVLLTACGAGVNASQPQTAPAAAQATQHALQAPAATTAFLPAATQAMATEAAATAPTATEAAASASQVVTPVQTATLAAPTAAPAATANPTSTASQGAAIGVQVPTTCTPGALTPAETEGPYYKANPPANSNLVQPGMAGTKMTVTGYVFNAQCQPVSGARVDFWQADSQGQYDNNGYTLRGYQLTDAQGRYTVETVVPGLYPGRTRHIHVKITAPGGATLATQLYFPGEAANNRDGIFDPKMTMQVQQTAGGELGTFNFEIQG
jgi:protocatechuate 3,4-dioxygenase beta subunit